LGEIATSLNRPEEMPSDDAELLFRCKSRGHPGDVRSGKFSRFRGRRYPKPMHAHPVRLMQGRVVRQETIQLKFRVPGSQESAEIAIAAGDRSAPKSPEIGLSESSSRRISGPTWATD